MAKKEIAQTSQPSKLTIKIFVEPNGKAPTKGKNGDAGFDCYADLTGETFTINGKPSHPVLETSSFELSRFHSAKIPLGFHYAFFIDGQPTTDYYFEIRNRSGFGTKECVVELAAICDASYRGVPHYSIAKVAGSTTVITHGQKICQVLLHPFVDPHQVELVIVNSLDELGSTSRGGAGFGSSGN